MAGRLQIIARGLTTTLARTDGQAALDALAEAILADTQDGGAYDLDITEVLVQWEAVGDDELQVKLVRDPSSTVTTDVAALRTTVQSALLNQNVITVAPTASMEIADQSSRIT